MGIAFGFVGLGSKKRGLAIVCIVLGILTFAFLVLMTILILSDPVLRERVEQESGAAVLKALL
jgi:hypothetical protein